MSDSTEFARKLVAPYSERIVDLMDDNRRLRECISDTEENARLLMAENASLRGLCLEMYRMARLMDANKHIEGMRVTDERREDLERRMGELGVEP